MNCFTFSAKIEARGEEYKVKTRSIAFIGSTETKSDVRVHSQNNSTYKKLDELTFEDLYIETPEQEFPYIKEASRQGIIWLRDKGDGIKTHLLMTIKNEGRHHPRPIH